MTAPSDLLTAGDAAALLASVALKSVMGKKLAALSGGVTVVRYASELNVTAWTPVDQRGKEDCERCCFAMLLCIPYESVPDFFAIFKQTRRDERQNWLRDNFGLNFISVTAGAGSSPMILPDALCIAGVESPTGHPAGHAVFGRTRHGAFELLHDPHPQREKSGKEPQHLNFLVRAHG